MRFHKKTIQVIIVLLIIYVICKLMKIFLASDRSDCRFFFSRPNLSNLPFEIKNTSNFCLWKYGDFVNGKAPKIPYRYDSLRQKVLKGLGDYKTNLIFSYEHYNTLRSSGNIDRDFFLGMSLLDSGLSVIDIDDYRSHPVLDRAIAFLFQQGCYVEVSPGGAGLHIFYKGAWDWTYGRNKGMKTLDHSDSSSTSCEVYSCYDRRFITLTGCSLQDNFDQKNHSMPDAENILEGLESLQNLFFGIEEEVLETFPSLLADTTSYFTVDDSTARRLAPNVASVLQRIKASRKESIPFQRLCVDNKPEQYLSSSEADMAFAGIIMRATDQMLSKKDRTQISRMIFERYRFKRPKLLKRLEYIDCTSIKALDNVSYCTQSDLQNSRQNRTNMEPRHQAPKDSIIKVCNTMKIFHLGRTFENHVYKFDQEGNELLVRMPTSLNQVDFKYFSELLFQYFDRIKALKNVDHEQLKKENLVVDMNALFKSAGKTPGGKNHKILLASLDRLSEVHMRYNKLIDKEKGLFQKSAGSLIAYEYKKYQCNTLKPKRQLSVRMHSAIIDVAFRAQYNYSLLNKTSYYSLNSDKAKLLYYHFCLSTFPGGRAITFTIELLLELWPKSALTKQQRYKKKQELIVLLKSIIAQIDEGRIRDLSVELIYSQDNNLEAVNVKKQHLRLV